MLNRLCVEHAPILLVEDDEGIREALCDVLTDAGHRVLCAEHGGGALLLLEQGLRPSLILLDLMMPVMDGWELMRRLGLSPAYAHIPIVTISAARSSQPSRACLALAKPVDIDAVLAAVAAHRLPSHGDPGDLGGLEEPHLVLATPASRAHLGLAEPGLRAGD